MTDMKRATELVAEALASAGAENPEHLADVAIAALADGINLRDHWGLIENLDDGWMEFDTLAEALESQERYPRDEEKLMVRVVSDWSEPA